jgi:hypothetical protein
VSVLFDSDDPELPEPPPTFEVPPEPVRRCWRCLGLDFWQSRLWADVWRCRACVAPAPGAEAGGETGGGA